MKKMIKRIFGIVSSFILGTQSRIFAIEQTDVYGPPPEPKNSGKILDIAQPAVYGPAPDPSVSTAPDPSVSTITGGQIFSIVASILLFIIGLMVILNKNIKKKVKVITVIILSITNIGIVKADTKNKFVF